MSDYTQLTDFSAKDLLITGNPNKLILGADVDAELAAIATAITSKYDSSDLASQAEAEAGASTSKLMTPQRTEQWGTAWADENAGMVGDIHAMTDPNADRILFWDDSAGAVSHLTVSTGLTLSGSTLTVNNSELAITESQISDLQSYLLPSDIGNTVQGYNAATAFYDTNTQWTNQLSVKLSGANSLFTVDANTSYDASIYLLENGVASLILQNDASENYVRLAKYNSAGSALVSDLRFKEDGTVNLSTGTLQIGGISVATLGVNTFLQAQTVSPTAADSILSLNAPAGYDSSIYFKENNVNSLIIRNDSSANAVRIYKYTGAGGLTSSWTVDESGNWDLDFGILQYGGIEVATVNDIAYRGAAARVSGTQSISTSTTTALNFASEDHDTDSIHSTVTNTSRLTVPSGVTKVILHGSATFVPNVSGTRQAFIAKNGGASAVNYSHESQTSPDGVLSDFLPVQSAVLTVTGGDYFELKVWQNSGSSLSAYGYLGMEIIE